MPEADIIPFSPAARSASALLSLRDIVVTRSGTRLIDGLTLSVPDNGTTVIMGPNGAGKSLMLRMLAGLIEPDAGTVHYPAGTNVARDIALVFQKPVMLRRSVWANMAHALKIHGVARQARSARIEKWLAIAGLSDLADRPARVLSGGEQQRLALARALATDPQYLLLDEPTANLDPHNTAMIESIVRQTANRGPAVVLVTHDSGQAERLGQEIRFVHRGRLVESGSAARFFANPQSAEAAAYLSGELVL